MVKLQIQFELWSIEADMLNVEREERKKEIKERRFSHNKNANEHLIQFVSILIYI